MTVKAIRLENFMAFADTGWIELRPITLLFGRNSSGKSTIIRALRILRQSLNSGPNRPLQFNETDGEIVAGGYKGVAHGYRSTEPGSPSAVTFHFQCQLPDTLDTVLEMINEWRKANGMPVILAQREECLTLSFVIGYNPHFDTELRSIRIDCPWQITHEPRSFTLLSIDWLDEITRFEADSDWWFSSDLPLLAELDWQWTTLELASGFLPTLNEPPLALLSNVWADLSATVRAFLEGLEFIGSVRPKPKIVDVLDYLIDDARWDSYSQVIRGEVNDNDLVAVDDWGKLTNLWREIHYLNHSKHTQFGLAELMVEDYFSPENDPLKASIVNVGFGISQVLPILLQSLFAMGGRTISIEEPESHLHAEAQGMLADFFTTIAGQSKRFILETHSEHLLLRFQRRIAETYYEEIRLDKEEHPAPDNGRYALQKQDFGLLFVTRNGIASHVEFIETDDCGQLVKPSEEFQDFFRYDYEDVEKLMESVAKIRRLEVVNGDNNRH